LLRHDSKPEKIEFKIMTTKEVADHLIKCAVMKVEEAKQETIY